MKELSKEIQKEVDKWYDSYIKEHGVSPRYGELLYKIKELKGEISNEN